MSAPLWVLLDVNIWVANLMATGRGRRGTTAQRIVSMIANGRWGDGGREVQLIVSLDMLDTLEQVLGRLEASSVNAQAYSEAVRDIMKHGPEELDPYLLLGGREQFAIADVEDAGVPATAFAARAHLVVTDNLKDFRTKESLRVDTRIVATSAGPRQLHALRHRRADVDLIVAHPLDVMSWLERRIDFEPASLWRQISAGP
ncbi:PIN domain-containing protein [Aquibium microcysteis]|uniref:PIN domain-containing protein n=1 Tax=Aquibium microcysteis TaxID=675281 RepID=UPI00165D0290|nr:PIN domain-containing protein [Aquibium microcysteis]